MKIKVALAGNPNVGKSTIFNILTGLHQHIGNWPGKTIEKKEGLCNFGGHTIDVVDLPGTYSLTASSIEELIARDYILKEEPDVVVVIVDSASIERTLYLVAQVSELTERIVIALNKIDIAERRGYKIDAEKLAQALGLPVVPTVATKAKGIRELLYKVIEVATNSSKLPKPTEIDYGQAQEALSSVHEIIASKPINNYPSRWVALKLLEGDSEVEQLASGRLSQDALQKIEAIRHRHEHEPAFIADARYGWIRKALTQSVIPPPSEVISFTDRLDHILTHRIFGLPLLAVIFASVFWLTFNLSAPLSNLIDLAFSALGELIKGLAGRAPALLLSLLADGVIAGVGAVASLFPVLLLFFIFLAILEDSGYMARAAFIMDRFMHILGLHGKAFLSVLLAYGCNIPGVMATRILEGERDRLIAISVNPLIPCAARYGVAAFFVAAFFTSHLQTPVMVGVYILSFVLVIFVGFLIQRFVVSGERAPFMMELPLYNYPNLRTILFLIWWRLIAFFKKAGTIIILVSIIIWLLSNLPGVPSSSLQDSYLGRIGKFLEPAGKLIGQDWRACVALLTGLAAKENSLATLGILYHTEGKRLVESLRAAMKPLEALVFIIFQFLYIPCLATVAAIWGETGSWRWTAFVVLYPLVLAFLVCVIVFQVGKLLGF